MDLVLWICPKCRQGGGGRKKQKLVGCHMYITPKGRCSRRFLIDMNAFSAVHIEFKDAHPLAPPGLASGYGEGGDRSTPRRHNYQSRNIIRNDGLRQG